MVCPIGATPAGEGGSYFGYRPQSGRLAARPEARGGNSWLGQNPPKGGDAELRGLTRPVVAMSARPPATREISSFVGGFFVGGDRQDRIPLWGARQRQTRRKPATQSSEATAPYAPGQSSCRSS